jgi:uncharacterized protein (UPF0147 family)
LDLLLGTSLLYFELNLNSYDKEYSSKSINTCVYFLSEVLRMIEDEIVLKNILKNAQKDCESIIELY